jgi:signal transduction histidine kinase
MPQSLLEFFSSDLFIPHGHCYLWKPGLVWLQVLSNGTIGVAYVAISTTLTYLVFRLRDQIPFRAMYLAFGAFIVLCGVTHFFDVYVVWKPAYWVDGSIRAVTALVSAATALMLPRLIPHAFVLARGARAAKDRGVALETAVKDLETMYQRTKELEQLKSQFFANVSHELRTPLTLILGPVEKLLASQDLTAAQRRDLEGVFRNSQMLHERVDDLLDAAKLEAGKMELAYAEVDVGQVVRLAAANFDGLASGHGVTFTVDAPSLPGQLDPSKLQRIVLNLLSNAFKFTPYGGRIRCAVSAAEVAVGTEPRRREAVITVGDSGPGIPATEREAIFERFRQLDGGSTRQVGGTGLGLAIVKDLVELHGGRIAVGEAPEGGALFTVHLPLVAPPGKDVQRRAGGGVKVTVAPPSPEGVAPSAAAEPAEVNDKPLVLVVEDNLEMNRFVREVFLGTYRTESAGDGHEGLRKALALRPDLILTDMMMPGLSGDELVRAIRVREELARIPIVLLTAKADDALRLRLLREGAQDFITKPFSSEELRARVGNLIALKRAQDVLDEAKTAATVANRELEAFSYSVSHDLRAPLRSLDGFSEALLEDYADQLGSTGKDYLERIRSAAQRMDQLIDDLLELARVSQGGLHAEDVDMAGVARSIVAQLEGVHTGRSVEITIPQRLPVHADPGLLRVALENLISNAWKFTGKRAHARIEIGSRTENGEVAYFVRDNGAGFDMINAKKLFRPFLRLHPEREFEGTGIGLATVQRIVHRHGGRVWAEGVVDQGATLYFTLPRRE